MPNRFQMSNSKNNDNLVHKPHAVFLVVLVLIIGIAVVIRIISDPPAISIEVKMAPPTPSSISSKEITHGDKTKKQIILTFDGGAATTSAETILAILAKHDIQGAFFLTGKFVETNPGLVNRMKTAGHEIFNHTYSHPRLTRLSDDEIKQQLVKMEQALESVAGISPKPYFRPPYADRDARVLAAAHKAGYQGVYWTVDALDWRGSAKINPISVENHVLSTLAPGNIYLLHLGDDIVGQILDETITIIEAKGYKVVSLTKGL